MPKIELLQTLWSVMSAFVDLAFGTDPVQQAQPSIIAGQHTDDSVSAVKPAEREYGYSKYLPLAQRATARRFGAK